MPTSSVPKRIQLAGNVSRLDGLSKATGGAEYTMDMQLPGFHYR